MTEIGRILVTGAAGFIGSHTCEKILQEGHNVVGLDNLNDYYSLKLKKYNLELLKKFENFKFIKADIREIDALLLIFKKHSFSDIIHFAAQAGIRYSLENPFLYQQVNVGGTLNLLELAHQFNCKNFIFASSSSVYGNQQKVPFSEDDTVTCPISVYASTKQAGEALCYTYHHLYSININCLRFFTVYGPRGRPDMAPHIFTSRILQGKKIKLFDNNPSTISRDFTFVSDIVDGIARTFKYNSGFEIINLGYGDPIKVIDFLSIIEELSGKTAKIEFIGQKPYDVRTTYADISKAKRKLGFKPRVGINEGLEKFFNWFKEYYRFF